MFDDAIGFVLQEEVCGFATIDNPGAYHSDPKDPGGETNWGIAKASHPNVDIKHLTREQAVAIYRTEYWEVMRCDKMPAALAILVFDTAVNEGVSVASVLLQEALAVTVDGHIGPLTLKAANSEDVSALVNEFTARRAVAYALDPNARTYELGWARRFIAALRYSLKFIT